MTRQVKINESVIDQFPVFDFDGYTKKTGETSFTSTLWRDGAVKAISVNINEIGTSGEYKVDFIPDQEGFWKLEILVDYNKDTFAFEYVTVTNDFDDLYAGIRRLLGLSHENAFIDNTVHDPDSQLLSARVRIFDSKANCDLATDGGSETTGLIATYTITTVYDGVNEFGTFKQVRDS
jgi:hypothetical protein